MRIVPGRTSRSFAATFVPHNMHTRARIVGTLTSLALTAIAVLHFVWLVSPWPLGSWNEWSHAFGNEQFRVSDSVMTIVALLFLLAGYVLAVRVALLPRIGPMWLYRTGTIGIAVILTARALLGFAEMSQSYLNPLTPEPFRETIGLYLSIYLPVFLLLGFAAAYVTLRAESRS